MAIDPRSRERLEALGRRLPQALPSPQPPTAKPDQRRRHPVETEEDPAQLFRELMGASPDGTVPDHLLQRLRDLERPRLRPGDGDSKVSGAAPPEADDPYRIFQELLLEEHDEPVPPAAAQPTPGRRRRSRASR